MSTAAAGSTLRCDQGGVILEILTDGLDLAETFAVGGRLDHLVIDTDLALAQAFLVAVRRDGAAFDCRVAILLRGRSRVLYLDGIKLDGQILMMVRPADTHGFASTHAALDAIAGLNNRLVNRQREVARAAMQIARLAGGTAVMPPAAVEAPPPGAPEPRPALFSPRESEVVAMLLDGLPNRVIAERLGIPESAVKARLRSIYRKLGVASRAQAIMAIMASNAPPWGRARALR